MEPSPISSIKINVNPFLRLRHVIIIAPSITNTQIGYNFRKNITNVNPL